MKTDIIKGALKRKVKFYPFDNLRYWGNVIGIKSNDKLPIC